MGHNREQEDSPTETPTVIQHSILGFQQNILNNFHGELPLL
jgi:hypothetical protein